MSRRFFTLTKCSSGLSVRRAQAAARNSSTDIPSRTPTVAVVPSGRDTLTAASPSSRDICITRLITGEISPKRAITNAVSSSKASELQTFVINLSFVSLRGLIPTSRNYGTVLNPYFLRKSFDGLFVRNNLRVTSYIIFGFTYVTSKDSTCLQRLDHAMCAVEGRRC